MTGAALLAVIAVAGCASGSTPASDGGAAGTASTAPAAADAVASTAAAPAPTGSCYQWDGLPYLEGVSVTLRQMADDEEIYGTGSDAVTHDGLAVQVDAQPLVNMLTTLPSADANELQNDVLSVAINAYSATPGQLDTAADNAIDLAGQFASLCYTSA
jgi:hypothetical protein